MYPGHWAEIKGDSPALIHAGSGKALSFRALNDRSNQIAQLLHLRGLRPGDHIALLMENHLEYLAIAWAAFFSKLRMTCWTLVLSQVTSRKAGS